MPRGISLHIGLNRVSDNQYGDEFEPLLACENDARKMRDLTQSQGFQPTLLINDEATAGRVIEFIRQSAARLVPGDFFLLSFSGHGSQIPNEPNGDQEQDGKDETLVLFDRNLIDDELVVLWSQFRLDVRVLVIADSCHSGSVAVALSSRRGRRSRAIKDLAQRNHWERFRSVYDNIRRDLPNLQSLAINASVLSLSACRDDETTDDGEDNLSNSAFTTALLKNWDEGRFNRDYVAFHRELLDELSGSQEPEIRRTGSSQIPFIRQRPFTI